MRDFFEIKQVGIDHPVNNDGLLELFEDSLDPLLGLLSFLVFPNLDIDLQEDVFNYVGLQLLAA